MELTKHNLRLLIFEDVLHYHPDCKGLIQPTLDAATAAMPEGGGAQRPNGPPSGDSNGAVASEAAGAGPLPQPPAAAGSGSGSKANASANSNVAANGGGAMNASTTSASTAAAGDEDSQVCILFNMR